MGSSEPALRVSARRDDGALLVTYGQAALVVSDIGRWRTSMLSALARGLWEPVDEPVPDDLVSARELDVLRQLNRELSEMGHGA